MEWARGAVQALLSTAEARAERERLASHYASATHGAALRRQLQDITARVASRTRDALAESAAAGERLRSQAKAVLEAAEKDVVRTREQAKAQAERVAGEVDLTIQARLERAQRRLDESERGAKVLRERAATDLARLRTEAHEHLRSVREEATTTLAAARADADTIRAQARDLLLRARAEVGTLAERRDDITEQLGYLSGVIEALAVSEHSATVAEDTIAHHESTKQETIGTR